MSEVSKASLADQQYLAQRSGRPTTGANPSLRSFLKKEPIITWLKERAGLGPWAELGCGDRSLLEEVENLLPEFSNKRDLWGFDHSKVAIDLARQQGSCHYEIADLTEKIPGGPYSFLLDGHFLHCLSSLPELYQTLGNILKSLKPGGIFAGEVMTIHKNLSFDSDLSFDYEQRILSYEDRPIRTILEAREWEDLFLNSGFEISYFVCQASIKMIPSHHRHDPMNGDPECLRFCLKRPE